MSPNDLRSGLRLQLPIFPAGVTEINNRIAVQKEAGKVSYLCGQLPVPWPFPEGPLGICGSSAR
jgi:hypothetical protein